MKPVPGNRFDSHSKKQDDAGLERGGDMGEKHAQGEKFEPGALVSLISCLRNEAILYTQLFWGAFLIQLSLTGIIIKVKGRDTKKFCLSPNDRCLSLSFSLPLPFLFQMIWLSAHNILCLNPSWPQSAIGLHFFLVKGNSYPSPKMEEFSYAPFCSHRALWA